MDSFKPGKYFGFIYINGVSERISYDKVGNYIIKFEFNGGTNYRHENELIVIHNIITDYNKGALNG